jgi:hypothetical protein
MGRMIEISGRQSARIPAMAASCLVSAALSIAVASAQVPPQRLAPEGTPPPSAAPPPNLIAPPAPAPEQQPAAPREQQPAWFDTLGHWFDESVTNMNKGWDDMNKGLKSTLGAVGGQANDTTKSATEAASNMAKGAAKGAVDAAGAVGRLGTARLVSGQSLCALAPNGAPDCRGAAESLCKAAGFMSGSSIDYVTSEKCPSEAYLAGRRPAPGECTTEHTVTRALCQ